MQLKCQNLPKHTKTKQVLQGYTFCFWSSDLWLFSLPRNSAKKMLIPNTQHYPPKNAHPSVWYDKVSSLEYLVVQSSRGSFGPGWAGCAFCPPNVWVLFCCYWLRTTGIQYSHIAVFTPSPTRASTPQGLHSNGSFIEHLDYCTIKSIANSPVCHLQVGWMALTSCFLLSH